MSESAVMGARTSAAAGVVAPSLRPTGGRDPSVRDAMERYKTDRNASQPPSTDAMDLRQFSVNFPRRNAQAAITKSTLIDLAAG